MPRLVAELHAQFAESAKLEQAINANLKGLGYPKGATLSHLLIGALAPLELNNDMLSPEGAACDNPALGWRPNGGAMPQP